MSYSLRCYCACSILVHSFYSLSVQAVRSQNTVFVGNDTDLLVLMLYHSEMESNVLFLNRSRSNDQRVWNIKKTKSALGLDFCSNIAFVHALLGCDTTSRIHGIEKSVALRLMYIFATKQQSLAVQLLLTVKS